MQDHSEPIAALGRRLEEAEQYLSIGELRTRRPQLEAEMSRPDLWDDADNARRVQQELSAVSDDLDRYARLDEQVTYAAELFDLARELDDDSQEGEIAEAIAALETEFEELELRSLFTGEYDEGDAVCQVKSGEGGTDAQD